MTTLVSFLEALIVSVGFLYAAYCLVDLGLCCVRWTARSIWPQALKRAGSNTFTSAVARARAALDAKLAAPYRPPSK